MRYYCTDCKESFLGYANTDNCPRCGSYDVLPVLHKEDSVATEVRVLDED